MAELIERDEPGMDLVREWLASATNPVTVLDGDPEAGRRSLFALQVTSRSPMGGLALETGGLLIDGGWVRVLASGHARLPRTIDAWNGLREGQMLRCPGAMLLGDDAIGGFFAADCGGIAGGERHVYYYAPDALAWTKVADSYSAWLLGLFAGDLAAFYGGLRWTGWRDAVDQLTGDRAFSVYPPLWAAGPPIEQRSRRAVPIEELWDLHVVEFPKQLRG